MNSGLGDSQGPSKLSLVYVLKDPGKMSAEPCRQLRGLSFESSELASQLIVSVSVLKGEAGDKGTHGEYCELNIERLRS